MILVCLLFCFVLFFPPIQPSLEEELCGGDRVDGHDLHQQSGETKAGTHQCGAGAHRRVQTGPTEEVCQRGVLVLRVSFTRFRLRLYLYLYSVYA